jgi:metal-dependent amidase/aminoacylase/carboxypeptidase family protein
MMVHPGPYDELDPSFQACQHYDVEFFGKDSHAAFAPEEGINALDAFVQAYVNISTLRQAMVDDDRIHCKVTRGGDAVNVVPSHTKSEWLIRSGSVERLAELIPKVKACFEGAAIATGCRFEWHETAHPYESMRNNDVMTDLYAANSEAIGRPMPTHAEQGGGSGSSDMGNVSQIVPSIHPMLGMDCGDAVNHQPEFADRTVEPGGESALRDGALGMAYTVIDMAEQDVWDRLGA